MQGVWTYVQDVGQALIKVSSAASRGFRPSSGTGYHNDSHTCPSFCLSFKPSQYFYASKANSTWGMSSRPCSGLSFALGAEQTEKVQKLGKS